MITHYLTLKALVNELRTTILGSTIIEVYSQQKNELVVALDIAGSDNSALLISIEPAFNVLYLRQRTTRAKRNSADLFQEIVRKKIEGVAMLSYDRAVSFVIEGSLTLLAQLYNTAASNTLLIDQGQAIRESFKRNSVLRGTSFQPRQERCPDTILEDRKIFLHSIRSHPQLEALTALKTTLPFLGTVYAREACLLAGIDEKTLVGELPENMLEKMQTEVTRFLLRSPKPVVYAKGAHMEFLSLLPLQHLAHDHSAMEFARVNDAIEYVIRNSARSQNVHDEKSELLKKLQSELAKLRRSIHATNEQLGHGTNAQEYDSMGTLLTSNIHLLTKGMKEAVVDDFISGEGTRTIQLDPRLSPAQNAQRYFDKAKKAEVARKEAESRLADIIPRAEQFEVMLREFKKKETLLDVKEFITTHRDQLIRMKLMHEKQNEPPPPFRIFTVAGGLEVWVGKNSANNDLLTMKYAKQNDLWFHVRGAGGSHTILRTKSKEPPPKEAIRQAAAIAAYYSKMRNAGTVPVAYCPRKYVRKPKGVREGAVVLDREEMVFVSPRLP